MKLLYCIGLLLAGLMGISFLIVEDILSLWFFPCCLLPSAIFLDHFYSSGTYSWKVLKYSLTGGVIGMTVLGFFLMEFPGMRYFFFGGVALAFLLPAFFAPELLLYLIGNWMLERKDKIAGSSKRSSPEFE